MSGRSCTMKGSHRGTGELGWDDWNWLIVLIGRGLLHTGWVHDAIRPSYRELESPGDSSR